MDARLQELVQARHNRRPVMAIYHGTSFHPMEALKSPRWEDFDLERTEEAKLNRFAYLGDGFTLREAKDGSIGATQT